MLKVNFIHIIKDLNIYRRMTIRTRVIIFFLILIIISQGIMGIVTYSITSNIIERKVDEQITSTLSQIDGQIRMVIDSVERVSDLVFSSDIIQEEIRKYKNIKYQRFSNITICNNYLSEVARSNRYIHSILVLADNGKNLRFGNVSTIDINELKKNEWFNNVKSLDGKKYWLNTYSSNYFYNIGNLEDRNVLSNVRLLKDFYKEETTGCLIINVKESTIEGIYSGFEKSYQRKFMILTKSGKVVSSSQKALIGRDLSNEPYISKILATNGSFKYRIDDIPYLITSVNSNSLDWILVSITPYKYITEETVNIRNLFLLISIGCLILLLIFNVIFSNSVLKPIKVLAATMDKAAHGDFSVRVRIDSEDEVSIAAKSFNIMISKIESLIKEVYIANVKKKEAEFKAFQAQINPHFLYNTLESVNSLAKIKGERDISNIIIALSRFLRISINKGNEFLTIREEIEHVKYYLEILERRYEDKFSVDFEINNEILKFKMIKLIIQPIVENAIYHGLELKEGKGYIKISGDIQDGNIIFIIKDNGIGMYQEQLQKINDALELGESKDNTIYGILNVNERIRLNFGEGYGLVYESVRNIGTSVKVMLPILKGDEEQDVQSFNC